MKSFEVQIQQSGGWNTDSTYDDRELAELRARQVESGSRTATVRVVEEVFVEETQKYVLRTIYRGTRSQQTTQDKVDESRQARTETVVADRPNERKEPEKTKESEKREEPETRKEPERAPEKQRTPPAKKRKSLSAGQLFAIFILIVGLGIAVMIALEYFLKLS